MNRWGIPQELEREIRARDICCVYCGVRLIEKVPRGECRKNAATWEHIINDASIVSSDNIARCCSACNSSKGAKDLGQWMMTNYCKVHGISKGSVAPVIRKALRQEKLTTAIS